MIELLPGWSVATSIPAEVLDGLARGTYALHGGVIRRAPGTDGAGQIVRHLLPAQHDPSDVAQLGGGLDPSHSQATQHLLQVTTNTMHLSGLNLAVSAIGFAVLHAKLTALDESLKAVKDSVDGIARLLELEERAKLKSALKFLAMVMQEGSVVTREQQLLQGILNVFGPVSAKYRELLPDSTSETAMACQEYFALTSLATATCSAELGMVGAARRNLEDDYTIWAEQARRIADRDLLGRHPERFMAGEFAPEVSLSEVSAWLNFVRDEPKSEQQRIDELRERVRLSPGGEGSWIPWPANPRAPEPTRVVEADKKETIPALRRLVARDGVFRGYVDQYVLLAEGRLTPSAFQRKLDALDGDAVVSGYVILQPTQSEAR